MNHDFYGREQRTQPRRVQVVEGEVIGGARDSRGGRFGAFAGVPLSQGDQLFLQGKMEATVGSIRAAFTVAQAKIAAGAVVASLFPAVGLALSVLGIGGSTGSTNITRENVSNALKSLQGAFEQNVIGSMPRVYAGELTADKWFDMVRPYIDGIKGILDELDASGTAASMKAVFDGMWGDTQKFLVRFKEGVERTFDFMPFIVGGAALLGVYLVVTRLVPQSSPRPALSGYRKKSRKLRLTP